MMVQSKSDLNEKSVQQMVRLYKLGSYIDRQMPCAGTRNSAGRSMPSKGLPGTPEGSHRAGGRASTLGPPGFYFSFAAFTSSRTTESVTNCSSSPWMEETARTAPGKEAAAVRARRFRLRLEGNAPALKSALTTCSWLFRTAWTSVVVPFSSVVDTARPGQKSKTAKSHKHI